MNKHKKEFDLLNEYMSMYIQLVFQSRRGVLPSFEYFKENYQSEAYSLSTPHYVEAYKWSNGLFSKVPTAGLGTAGFNAYKFYNYWRGVKFYTGNNTFGNLTYLKVITAQSILDESTL